MDTKKLRQKILDLAIHGKLVPQDPNDEPASVLLERIRAEKEALIKEGKIKRAKKTTASDTSHYENFTNDEIPQEWEVASLSDLFILNPKNYADDNTLAGFIPMNLVDDGYSGSHSLEPKQWGEIRTGYSHFSNGDIGIAKISPCFENRKSVIFNNLPNGIGSGTTELTVLRSIGVYSRFYLLLFKSDWYISQGTKEFKGVVGQQRVNKFIFTDLLVPVPPLEEQERIVSEVEKWFALIALLDESEQSIDFTIKILKSKVLDLAIHGRLVPQDPTDEPASELLKRINPKAMISCDNPHYIHEYQIPNNWAWTTLGAIGKWQSGGTPSRMHKEYYGGHIPWLKTGDLNDGIITEIPERITELGIENSSAKLNPVGSILIAMYGATIGKVGILGIPATTNQACCACVDYNGIIQKYLFYFLLSHKEEFIALGGGGAQPNISKEIITKTPIPIPPMEEQLRIVEKIEKLYSQLDMIKESLQA